MIKTMHKAAVFASLMFTSVSSFAGDFSAMYVFGDSLSDTGNLKAVTQDPNMPSRFTNGPVVVEVIANALGLTLSNSQNSWRCCPHKCALRGSDRWQ